MDYNSYSTYFETAAINNKILKHDPTGTPKRVAFYEIDMDDILSEAKLNMVSMSMLLEAPEIKPLDNLSDNIRKLINGAFVIVEELKPSQTRNKKTILNDTLKVAQQVVSKMLNDHKKSKGNPDYLPMMRDFDVNSCRFQKVGPILGKHYGYRVEFVFGNRFENNLQLNPAEWDNETKFSIFN